MKGQVISGEFGKILIRQKSGQDIELGELMISDHEGQKILLQVYDLMYGSQFSQINLELMSGMKLEEENDLEFMEPHLRNYKLALLKNLLVIQNNQARVAKTLPEFFSHVREITGDDIQFLTLPKKPLYIGKLRSGSKTIEADIYLEGDKALAEHILIPASTGKGKSNLTSCMLWNSLDKDYCASLVLDPHDEYYGRNTLGLKDHPKDKTIYYTSSPPAGCRTLKINLECITPGHFNGVMNWSDPQKEALQAYYRIFKKGWIEALLTEKPPDGFAEATIGVVKRRLLSLLNIRLAKEALKCEGVFDNKAGETTIKDISNELEKAKTVIIDTSNFSGAVEILIGSMITSEIFRKYRNYKIKGTLKDKPVISIVLEEAPRVLGRDVLEKGTNIFSTIAREGRKFKVGLIAITQLPSLIPRQILANMNTKIILGIEMAPERQAIIDSASQDMSTDARSIASLDKGEAIITSNFVKFATPIAIPYFPDLVKKTQNRYNKEKYINKFSGVKLHGTAKTS